MKKQVLLSLTALLLCMLFIIPASAAGDDGIMPLWDSIGDIVTEVSFDGSEGRFSVDVARLFGITTSLEATLTLYKYVDGDWVYMDSISGSSTRSLSLYKTFEAESGVTYKAVAEVTAYSSAGAETATVDDIETCP